MIATVCTIMVDYILRLLYCTPTLVDTVMRANKLTVACCLTNARK